MDDRSLDSSLTNPLCPECRSYIHRYIEPCPVCGFDRPGDLARAAEAWGGLRSRGGGVDEARARATAGASDAERRFRLARQLVMRYQGGLPGSPSPADVSLMYDGRRIVVTDVNSKRPIAAIAPSDVLGAIPSARRTARSDGWRSALASGSALAHDAATWGGDFTLVAMHEGRVVQLGLANRPGFFATKARSDYFVNLAREFADLCDAAASVRELEAGPHRYAVAIGLASGGRDDGAIPGAGERGAATAAGVAAVDSSFGTPRRSAAGDTLAALLDQLEEAYRGGLISEAERDAKRAEILRRF